LKAKGQQSTGPPGVALLPGRGGGLPAFYIPARVKCRGIASGELQRQPGDCDKTPRNNPGKPIFLHFLQSKSEVSPFFGFFGQLFEKYIPTWNNKKVLTQFSFYRL
jgi:hypothetical protein